MLRQLLYSLCLVCGLVCLAACGSGQTSPTESPNLPNPASVYCEQNGGKLVMRQDATGGTAGICVFGDGSECDEWAYFRGECKPGDNRAAVQTTAFPVRAQSIPTASPDLARNGWKVYRDTQLGYSFDYPSDAEITHADDPQRTLTVEGPMVGEDKWPIIYFNHPSDREDYRPPEGVDLEKWLTEHNLLMAGGKGGEVRKPDTQIGGTKAIHTRFERSPQSYAYDKYFFAHSQQLYSVVILHTGDREDWTLYDHFLTSIQFDP